MGIKKMICPLCPPFIFLESGESHIKELEDLVPGERPLSDVVVATLCYLHIAKGVGGPRPQEDGKASSH